MNLRHLSARTAAVGISAVVAGGALVAGATTAASAATASNTYTCDVAVLSTTFDTTLTVTGDAPAKAPAGSTVKAKTISITVQATVPSEISGTLGEFGVTHARADDFSLAVGKATASVPIEGDLGMDGEDVVWNAAGKNKAFTLPGAGATSVNLPKSFTFTAETEAFGDVPIPCALKSGQKAKSIDSVKLSAQSTKTTAKVVKGKLQVTVKGSASPAVGKVTVLKGKKVVGSGTLKKGKATIALKKLDAGKNKLTVAYAGSPAFKASKTTVTVTK
jgi:hypothetical protein